jgi:hypothetical protein
MSEHTVKSLKELQKQMKEKEDNLDNNEENSDDDSEEENVIITNFVGSGGSSRKQDNSVIVSTLLAQHELDRNKIASLTKKMYKMEVETERIETKAHYLRLDFSNTTLQLEEYKEKVKQLTKKYKQRKIMDIFLIVVLSLWGYFCGHYF